MVSENKTLEQEETIRQVARKLGYSRTGANIHKRIKSALRAASLRYIINTENNHVSLETRNIEDYTRDELIKALLAAIGRAWTDRDEAIRLAARHLGFRRTGSAIRQHFKSVINGAIRRGLLEYEGDMIRKIQ